MRNLRRGFVVGVCVLFVAVGAVIGGGSSALAAWEELPDPPISFAPDRLELGENTWTYWDVLCMPFLVADDNSRIYLGHASDGLSYDEWYALDVENLSYITLADPGLNREIPEDCWLQMATGAYVDGKVYAISDAIGRLSEYDPVDNSWSWASLTSGYEYLEQSLVADGRHEVLYWIESGSEGYYDGILKSVNPDVGEESLKEFAIDYTWRTYVGLNVTESRAYIAGGFFVAGGGLFEHSYGESSQLSTIVNLRSGDWIEMSDVPVRTAMVGSGWGNDGLHFVGYRLWGDGVAGVFMALSKISKSQIYHYVYQPASDSWQTLQNDLPENCLPFSVAKQAEWLYGVFACTDGSDLTVKMFRSEIGEYNEPPNDDDANDDDTSDDDATDDDSLGDDDTGDDDTTSPDADAPADGDGDPSAGSGQADDACGC